MKLKYLTFVLIGILLFACEQPNSPDVTFDRKVDLPLVSDRTFQFLGEKGALIDSTDSDFKDFFSTDSDGQVTLSKEQDFDFGNLDDAIPEVNVTPTSINTTVGPIAMTDFSSGSGNLGSASFEDVTGVPPSAVPSGGYVLPPGSETVTIDVNTDYLQSATIDGDNGSITITVTNDMGFDVQEMEVSLLSDGTNLGTDAAPSPVTDESSETFEIVFSDGDVLQNLQAEVYVRWNSQPVTDPGELVVNQLQGQDLVASQVSAEIASQDFNTSGNVDIDDANFQFTQSDHYIELESGELVVDEIVNDIPLYIEPLVLSFPDIRRDPYGVGDSLVIRFEGTDRIPQSGSITDYPAIDLSDVRIYAEGNQIEYNVVGTTENTQGTGEKRTINATDQVSASVEINNLSIREAVGVVTPKDVIVNDDDPSNGTGVVDLYNDNEAELTTIEALEDLSDQLDGLEFADPTLSINYTSNIGVNTTIYASIVGAKPSGNSVYLQGLQGSPYYVSAGEIPTELTANGNPLSSSQLIKFTISASQSGTQSGAVQFDKTQTNVDEFLNNLPSQIRFIGVGNINSDNQPGSITDPVEFDPSMSVDIPLNFSATNASYTDTVGADLSDVPDPEEGENRITRGNVYVEYSNGLPFSAELNLVMLDENGNEVTTVSNNSGSSLSLDAGQIDSQTGFVSGETSGVMEIALSQSQLDVLHQTTDIEMSITLNTPTQGSIKVRDTDSISLSVSLSAAVESTVN